MSAGGMLSSLPPWRARWSVWIDATCTGSTGRGGIPAWMMPWDAGAVQLPGTLRDDFAPMRQEQHPFGSSNGIAEPMTEAAMIVLPLPVGATNRHLAPAGGNLAATRSITSTS